MASRTWLGHSEIRNAHDRAGALLLRTECKTGSCDVTNLRRLTLAFVIVGGVIGAFVKFTTGSFMPRESSVVEFSKLPEKIGQFVVEEELNKDRSLQLRSAQCDRSIFVGAYSIKEAPPEALSPILYPPDKWRSLYVYRGQTSDAFARIPAYMRLVGLRSIEALTMSAHDLSDEYVLSFHIPVECAIDPRSVVTASSVILQLAAIP